MPLLFVLAIVPILLMPPANLLMSWTSIPCPFVAIVPLLTMPPEKLETKPICMPAVLPPVIVPLLMMPPAKVEMLKQLETLGPRHERSGVDDAAQEARGAQDLNCRAGRNLAAAADDDAVAGRQDGAAAVDDRAADGAAQHLDRRGRDDGPAVDDVSPGKELVTVGRMPTPPAEIVPLLALVTPPEKLEM